MGSRLAGRSSRRVPVRRIRDGLRSRNVCSFQDPRGSGAIGQYQHTEQLGHSQLFSLQEKSDNLLFLAPSSDQKTTEVFRVLSKSGFNVHLLKSDTRYPLLGTLQVMFCLQHLALHLGRKLGLQECAFVTDKKRLALSSRLIY